MTLQVLKSKHCVDMNPGRLDFHKKVGNSGIK